MIYRNQDNSWEPPAGQPAVTLVQMVTTTQAANRDKRMTASERSVIVEVLSRVNRQTGNVWPSYGSIENETGYSPKVIASAMKKAIGVYLRPVRRGGHGAICYMMLPVSSTSDTEELKECSTSNTEEPEDCGTSNTEELESIEHDSELPLGKSSTSIMEDIPGYYTGEQKEPPNPPQAGGRACSSPPPTADSPHPAAVDPAPTKNFSTRARIGHNAEIANALDAVYRQAHGGTLMPQKWRNRISRMNGSAAVFVGVTAEVIHAGRQWFEAKYGGKNREFGIGHFENYLHEKAGKQAAAREKQAGVLDSARSAKKPDGQTQEEITAEIKKHADYFATLTDPQRDAYRKIASQGTFGARPGKHLERMAAYEAWKNKKMMEGAMT